MKYRTLILFAFLLFAPYMWATRDRHVIVDTVCHCSETRFQQVIDRFFYEFQADSKSLFTWAYLNIESEGNTETNGKDAIAIRYGKNTYNPTNRTADQALDIYVLGSRMFPNRHLGTVNHGTYMTATYSGSMLEAADFRFTMDSIAPNQIRLHSEFNIVFGKFLSLFITEKKWNVVAEWRFRQVFANLVEYAETGTVLKKPESSM